MTPRAPATSTRAPGGTSFLDGGGELGALMRAFDWSATPLGPPSGWPQSLRSAVSILLPSKAQIVLFWGPEFITLYNDAYRPVFGAKHPGALGRPASGCGRRSGRRTSSWRPWPMSCVTRSLHSGIPSTCSGWPTAGPEPRRRSTR